MERCGDFSAGVRTKRPGSKAFQMGKKLLHQHAAEALEKHPKIRDPLTKPRNASNLLKIKGRMTSCPKNEPKTSKPFALSQIDHRFGPDVHKIRIANTRAR